MRQQRWFFFAPAKIVVHENCIGLCCNWPKWEKETSTFISERQRKEYKKVAMIISRCHEKKESPSSSIFALPIVSPTWAVITRHPVIFSRSFKAHGNTRKEQGYEHKLASHALITYFSPIFCPRKYFFFVLMSADLAGNKLSSFFFNEWRKTTKL